MDFSAQLANLEAMLAFIRTQAASLGARQEQVRKIELASEEAIVNIISYAFNEAQGTITLGVQEGKDDKIEVIIKDLGPPFDPLKKAPKVDTTLPIEEREIGGLGIFLIDKMTDKALYERVEEANILHLWISK